MFNTMNTMYENNLQVQLLIGTTILRTNSATDPYANFAQGAADSTKLNFFANYWKTNESTVPRAFATLLSGLNASTTNSCSASGIAEIDAYCNTSFSYSVNQVCTSINIDPNGAFDATHCRARTRTQLRRVPYALHRRIQWRRARRYQHDRSMLQRRKEFGLLRRRNDQIVPPPAREPDHELLQYDGAIALRGQHQNLTCSSIRRKSTMSCCPQSPQYTPSCLSTVHRRYLQERFRRTDNSLAHQRRFSEQTFSTRSTASFAVAFLLSSAGLSSTISNEPMRPVSAIISITSSASR